MPWKVRREVYMLLCGCAIITLSLVVLAANTVNGPAVHRLLGLVGLLGGAAVILNLLPTNGHDKEHE